MRLELESTFHVRDEYHLLNTNELYEDRVSEIETKYAVHPTYELKYLIFKAREVRPIPPLPFEDQQLFKVGNLDMNSTYEKVNTVDIKVVLMRPRTIPYQKMVDMFAYTTNKINQDELYKGE